MKINKNILMEYLYLTIFVITLFVLKELIEYVFFTRKRNNIIEKFSDPTACGKIEWYHDNYDNIKKIFEMFTFNGSNVKNVTIPCQDYVEFKSVKTNQGSRIVLEPKNDAIYFEHFKWSGNLEENEISSPTITDSKCVSIYINTVTGTPTKNYLDFVSYTYQTSSKIPFYSDNTSTFSPPPADSTLYKIFARFDIDIAQDGVALNSILNDLNSQH